MKFIILGCGTSTGVPMVGCRCPVCSSTDRRDRRTRASLLIEADGKNILIDTSTDLRRQALREKIGRIDAVLFTHPHADHINGIDDLRGFHFLHKQVIPGFGAEHTISAISRVFPYIFKGQEQEGYAALLDPHVVDEAFELFGLRIVPIPLLHGHNLSTGYRIGDAAYLTDCSAIPDESMDKLRDLDLLVIDGLRYTPHYTHFNIDGALAMIATLKPRRAILTHLTHEVAYLDRDRLPEGVDFAFDGMTIECDGAAARAAAES